MEVIEALPLQGLIFFHWWRYFNLDFIININSVDEIVFIYFILALILTICQIDIEIFRHN